MDAGRFRRAIEAFDRANSEDPNRENGRPRELVHAERLTEWVKRLAPSPSEALLLAARCQHIRRWTIPRATFPEGREGYLRWRKTLAEFHAKAAGEILRGEGYPDEVVSRVRTLNLKQSLKTDPEVQTLEDALCLEFLEGEFATFSAKTDEAKMIEIIRKTWGKMSPRGRDAALKLPLGPSQRALVEQALGQKR